MLLYHQCGTKQTKKERIGQHVKQHFKYFIKMQVFLHYVSAMTQDTAIITRYCPYRLCFPLFQMLHINSRKSASPSSSSICAPSPASPPSV